MLLHLLVMYPPKYTNSKEEVIDNLLSSLQRAGLEAACWCWSDVKQSPVLKLHTPPPSFLLPVLKTYIEGYVAFCGWRVTSLEFRKNYMFLDIDFVNFEEKKR